MNLHEFQQRYKYNASTDSLGEGGFGKVFKAYDTYRDKWIALKIAEVKPGLENVRLLKEVELVAKLPVHPNIAYYEECYTFTSFDGEYDFGILQYYEEGNLLQLLNKNVLSLEQKQSILTQILNGLDFLHKNGIIHRDLKPQNILIVKRGDEYIPKITDFGISKKLDANKSSIFSNSLVGAGTLAYSSPEQLADKIIRKNTDLWSFGIIAFQVLTNELPFTTGEHSNTSESGRQELFRQINSGHISDKIYAIAEPWHNLIKTCLMPNAAQRVIGCEECFDRLKGNNPEERTSPKSGRILEPIIVKTILDNSQKTVLEEEVPEYSPLEDYEKRRKKVIAIIALCVITLVVFFIFKGTLTDSSEVIIEDLEDIYIESFDNPITTVKEKKLERDNQQKEKREEQKRNNLSNPVPSTNDVPKTDNSIIAKNTEISRAEPEVEEKKIFEIVEEMPSFPGGDAALMRWIGENLKYPTTAQESGIQGRVAIRFVISRTGNVEDVEVVRGVDPACDREAVRVIRAMPRWTPGRQNGLPVAVYFTLPILFRLREDEEANKKNSDPFISNVIFFAEKSSTIEVKQHHNLQEAIKWLNRNPSNKVKVVGYTDKRTGTASANSKISEERAKAVANYLMTKGGVNSNRIRVDWKGDTVQPYAENSWNNTAIIYQD